MITRPKTIICDIDGVIFEHTGDICELHARKPVILPGAKERFREWDREGCHIILMTGRRESVRKDTEKQLSAAGFFYDELIMGVGGGVRVLINDKKPDGDVTTQTLCLERNKGFKHMEDTFIEKPWGSETLLETNEFYTVKKLFMKEDHKCSLQYHELKHETIYILSGVMRLWIEMDKDYIDYEILGKGQSFVIPPRVVHRMEALEDCYYLESSTSELNDVVRLDDAYGRTSK
jgi:mannose-6-phosphate isomerase-like protein (cupin superfamily)